MGLPNIGPLELIIILAIALLIVGPGRLPEMGNAIGRTIREFRNASTDITDAAKVEPDSKAAAQPAPAPEAAQTAAPQPNTLSGEATPNSTTATPVATGDAASAPKTDGDDDA
jgi:sec-independent protein translocase protein TatA